MQHLLFTLSSEMATPSGGITEQVLAGKWRHLVEEAETCDQR